jgi:8-oxo-dGTP pyrophosphatase MutT (NUDIX family)
MMLNRLVQDLRDVPRWVADLDDSVHRATVAAVFAPRAGVPHLLFIRRAEFEGDPWSGHIALPGGRVDPQDADDTAAVCREVREEVGIDLVGAGTCLGRLGDVVSPPLKTRVVVTPFIYTLDSEPTLTLDPVEVADVHWIALDRLLSGEGRGTFRYRFCDQEIDLGCIDLDGVRIWGMTLRILEELIERIRRIG